MKNELTTSTIEKCLEWAYDKAVNGGLPGMDSAEELAKSYMKNSFGTAEDAKSMLNWQCSKSALSGFATSFGGFTTMLAALPANITSVLFIQVRTIAAIAYMAGLDIKDDKVKTLVYACLVASSTTDVMKTVGVKVGEKLAINAIKQIPVHVVKGINKAVSFRLLTKFGEKGLINLGKAVPFIGGLFGAMIDAASTKAVGNVAIKTFFPKN